MSDPRDNLIDMPPYSKTREPVKPYVPPPPKDNGLGMGADWKSANDERMAQMGKWHLNQTQSLECVHKEVSKWSPKLQWFLVCVLGIMAISFIYYLLRSL